MNFQLFNVLLQPCTLLHSTDCHPQPSITKPAHLPHPSHWILLLEAFPSDSASVQSRQNKSYSSPLYKRVFRNSSSKLSMTILNICFSTKIIYVYLHYITCLHPFLNSSSAKLIIQAFVCFGLDYVWSCTYFSVGHTVQCRWGSYPVPISSTGTLLVCLQ